MARTLPGLEPDCAADGVLVNRFLAGDERALSTLLERYESPLFQFLLGLLRDPHQAEDALQETWCRALQHLDSVDADHLRGWLFTVAYHQAMLVKRRQKLRACTDIAEAPVTDPAPGPEHLVEAREDLSRLKTLIDQLPPTQREVIRRRVYEDKPFREIAQDLDCPLNTALARMHDGLQRLRLLWGIENG